MKTCDELYMRRAIDLAARGMSCVSPNPRVGAVVVKDGKIIAEGWHRKYGENHAERNAIDSISDKSQLVGSTMYVTLEPCCHYGKTPPCADYLIENGIKKVFIGITDPNPKVAGGGIKKLLDAGVEVVTGLLEDECRYVCRFFLTAQKLKRPYVMLKWAESSDGYIGVKKSKPVNFWFTGEAAKVKVHMMRREYDSILVGTETVLQDDPSLTVRLVPGPSPVRVTFDLKGRLSGNFKIFDESAKTLVFCSKPFDYGPYAEVCCIDGLEDNLPQIIVSELFKRRINSLMIEGGEKTLSSFIRAGLCDEINIFRSSRHSNEIFSSLEYTEKIKAPLIPDSLHPSYFDSL